MISENIYLSGQFKKIDESCGIDTDTLMQSAVNALYNTIFSKERTHGKICIVCGKGNNGGDGYALACRLFRKNYNVDICAIEPPASPLAVKYYNEYKNMGGSFCDINNIVVDEQDTIVDCMFGFSFKGEIKGDYAKAVNIINSSQAFVIAADLPSGLCADTDEVKSLAVKADITCTFTAHKCATVSFPAKGLCGEVVVCDIGINTDTTKRFKPYATNNGKQYIKSLPKRNANSHKGCYGPLVALCGNEDMCGAAFLACNAAYRTGTGLVKLYTHKDGILPLKTMMPEVIIKEASDANAMLSEKAKALLIGCGCGRSYDGIITELLTHSNVPTVLDADGINCIAGNIELYKSVSCPLIVTPHPAEMSRLLSLSIEEINSSRIKYAKQFAMQYGFITVLKGSASIVASPDGRLYINSTGNSGLAKGGSGDVLAGIIASLCAQGIEPFESAVLGVYLHGAAADRLLEIKGPYALLPSELAEEAGKILYFG